MTRRTVITLSCLLIFGTAIQTASSMKPTDSVTSTVLDSVTASVLQTTTLSPFNCSGSKIVGSMTLTAPLIVIWVVQDKQDKPNFINALFSQFSCRFSENVTTVRVNFSIWATDEVCNFFNDTTYKNYTKDNVQPIILVTQGADIKFPPCIAFKAESTFVQATFAENHLALRGYAHSGRTDYIFSCADMTTSSHCHNDSLTAIGDIVEMTISPSRLQFVFQNITKKFFDDETVGMALGVSIGVGVVLAIVIGVAVVGILFKQMKAESAREHMKLAGAINAPKAKKAR